MSSTPTPTAIPLRAAESTPAAPYTARKHPAPPSNTQIPDEDHQAIVQTMRGDLAAYNQLVVKYQGFAYSVAYRILQSREAAADAVQESFLKSYRALGTFNGGSFRSWLARIVVNSCYDSIRQQRHMVTESLRDEPDYDNESSHGYQLMDMHESPHDYVERMELHARLELGLRALPHEQRLVVTLADIHGYHYDEISEITGLPMGTIKSRISRARLRLREFLLEEPELLP